MLEKAAGDWYAVMFVVVVFAMCMIVMMIQHLRLASCMAVRHAQLHSLATITNIHLGRLETLMQGKREQEEIEGIMLMTDESARQGRWQKRTHKIECLVNRLLEELKHTSRERRRSSDASASQAKRSTHHTATVAKPPAVLIPWICSNSRELEPPPELSSSELDELLGLHRAGSAHPPSSRSSPASPVKRLPTDKSPRRRFPETDKGRNKENTVREELGPTALNSRVRCPVEIQSRFAQWFLHEVRTFFCFRVHAMPSLIHIAMYGICDSAL